MNGPKDRLEMLFKIHGINPISEFRFHPKRRWRFDWALPESKIAFEYEGMFSKDGRCHKASGRHLTAKGYTGDIEKYNEAALCGWTVYRFNAVTVRDGRADDHLRRISATIKEVQN